MDINIYRALHALQVGKFGDGDQFLKNPMKEDLNYVDMQQLIYCSFPGMMKLYYLLTGKGVVTDENYQTDPHFNPESYNWIDLFDKSHNFLKYTKIEVIEHMMRDGWEDVVEVRKFAPLDAKGLYGKLHNKVVGQPKSQFIG